MKLSSLSRRDLEERLQGNGLCLHTGPFLARVRTALPSVAQGIALLYADNRVGDTEPFADFHIALRSPLSPRRWFAPQVQFEFDGRLPFKPLPLVQALPMLEWGLNWCIGFHAHQYLMVHAAVVERHGMAAILPGAPGAGKSTLTAFLAYNGWRLLSDELALVSLEDGSVTPLARPISLKNRSIDVIAERVPEAVLSARSPDTAKGTVALLKAPAASVQRSAEPARPAWFIFPRFKVGAGAMLEPTSKADTLIELGRNAFNYSIHGRRGFQTLARLVDDCACYSFTYSDLAEALSVFNALEPAWQTCADIPA